jgi:hypothetical protein
MHPDQEWSCTFRIDGGGLFWAGDVSYPWAEITREQCGTMRRRQAKLMLESGWTLSLIWGDGSYTENQRAFIEGERPFSETPRMVEVGILDIAGNVAGVCGYCSVDVTHRLVAFMAQVPTRFEDWSASERAEMAKTFGYQPWV